MDSNIQTTKKSCPREEISLYLDGELSADNEIHLEKHLSVCSNCLSEMNLQKQMLTALDFAFDNRREIELPKDFTKVIVAKAESEVSGLRCKKERFSAFLLFSALFLLLVVGFTAESEKIFTLLNDLGNQILAVGGFILHFTYNISIGIAVILRNLSQQIIFSSAFLAFIISSFLFFLFFAVQRFIFKLSRVKTS
jgi:predicted anti-sigma-YlaC factor YlaD